MNYKFDLNDPFQTKVPENKRTYYGVTSFRIEYTDGTFFDALRGICHQGAFPTSYQHVNKKWAPKSITTDLRQSNQHKDFYEYLLSPVESPYRNSGLFDGMERIVGDDGYLRAVKITNMQVRSKTLLNFLVMTRFPFENNERATFWKRLVDAGVSKAAALVAAHSFYLNGSDTYTKILRSDEHCAINIDPKGASQPSVVDIANGNPMDTSDPYVQHSNSFYGFSNLWGLAGKNDPNRITLSAYGVKGKTQVLPYTGSFKEMYKAAGGQAVFGLANPGNNVGPPYLFNDIVKSAPLWSAI